MGHSLCTEAASLPHSAGTCPCFADAELQWLAWEMPESPPHLSHWVHIINHRVHPGSTCFFCSVFSAVTGRRTTKDVSVSGCGCVPTGKVMGNEIRIPHKFDMSQNALFFRHPSHHQKTQTFLAHRHKTDKLDFWVLIYIIVSRVDRTPVWACPCSWDHSPPWTLPKTKRGERCWVFLFPWFSHLKVPFKLFLSVG